MDNGIVSSRKLDRECKRNIEVMWLLNGLTPDDKTICNFRRENAEHITRFFNEFCVTLAKAGYIDGKIVGVDGTKIRANNSKRNNYSAKKLDRHIAYIDKKIAEYLNELDKNDKITELEERKAKYNDYKASIERGEVTEVSTTDPDSRLMMQGNNGTDVSYNVQAAVDSKHKLVAGIMVTNEPNDQGQLSKVSKAVKDNLGVETMIVPADKGYYDTNDIKACHDEGITTLVARPRAKEPAEGIEFRKEDFRFDRENDCYHCPAGHVLKPYHKDENDMKRYRNISACKNCPSKEFCTKATYRTLGRHINDAHTEQNNKDLAENPDIYNLRQLLCEHPFGTVKRTMGIRQFLTRGLANVAAETALIFLCYNLKRLRNICQNNDKNDPKSNQFDQLPIVLSIFYLLLLKNAQNHRNRP
jgi:IS5 family transposase